MNTPSDNLLEQLAKIQGENEAKNLERFSSSIERPELEEKIETMISSVGASTKSLRKRKQTKWLVAMVAVITIFVGAKTIVYINFQLSSKGEYSQATSNLEHNNFSCSVTVPTDYTYMSVVSTELISTATFENGTHIIVFKESDSEFTLSVDTENLETEIEIVLIPSGYQGQYLEKNGTTLIWEQDGKFYFLYTDDEEINLLEIATTLEKL